MRLAFWSCRSGLRSLKTAGRTSPDSSWTSRRCIAKLPPLRSSSARIDRTRTSVQRCTVEGMEPFVIGHAEPSERGFDVIVGRCLGTPVTAVRELPAPASTSYALRRLMLDLDDGRTLDVLLKDFDVSRHASDVALWHGARERYVYETVLAGRDLGTPELYGLVWDEPSGRHWLLLEFVQGRTLRQSPIEDW